MTSRTDRGHDAAVLFDAAGTLFAMHPPLHDLISRMLADTGAACTSESVARGIAYVESRYGVPDDQPTAAARLEAWSEHCQRILVAVDVIHSVGRVHELAHAAAAAITDPVNYRVLQGIPELLTLLRSAGVRMGIVSNFDDLLFDILSHTRLDIYFPVVVNSFGFGAYKPDPRIFLCAAQAIGAEPSHTYVLGDSAYSDIEGARRAGLCGILFDPDDSQPCFGGQRITEPLQLVELIGL